MMRLAETFPAFALPAPPGLFGLFALDGFLGGRWAELADEQLYVLRPARGLHGEAPEQRRLLAGRELRAPAPVGGTSASPSSRSTAEVGSVPVMQ